METTYKSYHTLMIEEVEAKTEAKVEKRSKMEIAKNLIGKIPNFEIAAVTGIPLTQVEQLEADS